MDITVLEVKKNGDIKELNRSSDGEWGGSSVDTAFKSVLAEIATKEMIENYSRKYPYDYLSLFKDFELSKRTSLYIENTRLFPQGMLGNVRHRRKHPDQQF